MAAHAGLLVLIGSGETGPQMARVQRELVERLVDGRRPGSKLRAAVLDTPYGFQSNADAISSNLVDFLERRLGAVASVASLRRADGDELDRERAFGCIRDSDLLFSGPGSPSYAARNWRPTRVPQLLLEALGRGGAVVMASAAAMTLGALVMPVYEIYKAGEDPRWLPGLDLLAALGLGGAVVVAHWDNAEGGGHDTRFCFIGGHRLRTLEEQLPTGAFLLGIDEHTALVIDLSQGTLTVRGQGRLTIRRDGHEARHGAGTRLDLAELAGSPTNRPLPAAPAQGQTPRMEGQGGPGGAPSSVDALVRELLSLEGEELRSGIVRLGGLAAQAMSDSSRLVPELIGALIEVRASARAGGDYATADLIRDRLKALGIELDDGTQGTRYRLMG